MPNARVWHNDDSRVLATYRNVFISVWRMHPYRNYIAEATPMCEAILVDYPQGMHVLVIAESTVSNVEAKDLQEGVSIMRTYMARVRSIAAVIKGDRVQSTLVRAAGTALLTLAKHHRNVGMYADLPTAVRSLETSAEGVFSGSGLTLYLSSLGAG